MNRNREWRTYLSVLWMILCPYGDLAVPVRTAVIRLPVRHQVLTLSRVWVWGDYIRDFRSLAAVSLLKDASTYPLRRRFLALSEVAISAVAVCVVSYQRVARIRR
jgi:hypothetical protein